MRPWRSTCVASMITSPAPELASMPRWLMCQGPATPSSALYWHIGETTRRLDSSTPASFNGENRALISDSIFGRDLIGLREKADRGRIIEDAAAGATAPAGRMMSQQ